MVTHIYVKALKCHKVYISKSFDKCNKYFSKYMVSASQRLV